LDVDEATLIAMDLVFGWRTAVLTVAAAILLPLAVALSTSFQNRLAARALAALLIIMTGVFVPWLIGFAGFYDRWWWLTFAPFSNALLVPPLLYLHAYALVTGRWSPAVGRHLLPGAIQFAYQTAAFLLPTPLKRHWADLAFTTGNAIVASLLAISFVVYGAWTIRLLHDYRDALSQKRSAVPPRTPASMRAATRRSGRSSGAVTPRFCRCRAGVSTIASGIGAAGSIRRSTGWSPSGCRDWVVDLRANEGGGGSTAVMRSPNGW
jgi:hypothetical protein